VRGFLLQALLQQHEARSMRSNKDGLVLLLLRCMWARACGCLRVRTAALELAAWQSQQP
jgi:hypothetical protein